MNVPDSVAVPVIVNLFVVLLYVPVIPPGSEPVSCISVAIEVVSYTTFVNIGLLIQIVFEAVPCINVIVAFGLIVMVPVVVAVTQSPVVAMV